MSFSGPENTPIAAGYVGEPMYEAALDYAYELQRKAWRRQEKRRRRIRRLRRARFQQRLRAAIARVKGAQ